VVKGGKLEYLERVRSRKKIINHSTSSAGIQGSRFPPIEARGKGKTGEKTKKKKKREKM
jgi:hypothetical protein